MDACSSDEQPPEDGAPAAQEEARFLELLERARRREPGALAELLGLYQAELRGMARRSLGPGLRLEMDSEDLQQSVVRELLRDLDKPLLQRRSDFRRWLAAVMQNKLRKKARDAGRQKRNGGPRLSLDAQQDGSSEVAGGLPPAPTPSPSSALIAAERQQQVQTALASLEPLQRRLVELRLRDGRPWNEVARSLGLTEKATQAQWAKIRLRLGRLLDP
jgi:RNA polymerase sigma factor (sigma-70 family)